MHFIFDAVAPFVEYKRGVRFSWVVPFPVRGDETPDDMTDSQGNEGDSRLTEWTSYGVRGYEYVFHSCVSVHLLIPFSKAQVDCRL